jgi:capsular polysaccharide biosynthesis protein
MEKKSRDKIITLENILSIFKKNLGLIFLTTLLVSVVGTGYSMFLATPKYTASTQLIAKVSNNDGDSLAGQVQAANQMSTTLAQVVVSPTIIKDAKKNLHINKSVSDIKKNLNVTASPTSQVVTLTVTDTNAYTASDMANEISKVFIKKAPELMNVSNISILAKAQPNTIPTSPNKKLIIIGSVLAGFILGILLSMSKVLLNTKIQTQSDLEEMDMNYLGGVSKIK